MVKSILHNGSKLCYQILGKGKTVVFIHGYCEDSFIWKNILTQLATSYQVICIDLPGYGQSDLPKNKALSFELFADSVFAVLKNEKVSKATICGHSMGGYTALYFAKKHSDLLLGIGLINSHCFEDSEERKVNRKKAISFIQKRGTELFLKEFYPNLFAPQHLEKNKKLIETLYEKGLKISSQAVTETAQAMIDRKDTSSILKQLKVPVLMLCGALDNAVPKDYSLKMASYPAICDFHLFPKCGHMAMFEEKTNFTKSLYSFLELTTT